MKATLANNLILLSSALVMGSTTNAYSLSDSPAQMEKRLSTTTEPDDEPHPKLMHLYAHVESALRPSKETDVAFYVNGQGKISETLKISNAPVESVEPESALLGATEPYPANTTVAIITMESTARGEAAALSGVAHGLVDEGVVPVKDPRFMAYELLFTTSATSPHGELTVNIQFLDEACQVYGNVDGLECSLCEPSDSASGVGIESPHVAHGGCIDIIYLLSLSTDSVAPTLSPAPTPAPSVQPVPRNTSIALSVVAGVLFLCALVAIAFTCFWQRKKSDGKMAVDEQKYEESSV